MVHRFYFRSLKTAWLYCVCAAVDSHVYQTRLSEQSLLHLVTYTDLYISNRLWVSETFLREEIKKTSLVWVRNQRTRTSVWRAKAGGIWTGGVASWLPWLWSEDDAFPSINRYLHARAANNLFLIRHLHLAANLLHSGSLKLNSVEISWLPGMHQTWWILPSFDNNNTTKKKKKLKKLWKVGFVSSWEQTWHSRK